MSVYFVTGKLGGGKTLVTVKHIRDYLQEGRKVATNLDLYMENLVNHRSRATVIRLPDKPRLEDMEMLGLGHDEPKYNAKRNGLIVLDELGTWFNSRNWNDKSRGPFIDFLLHIRKKRWDVMFIVQDLDIVDKQLRQSLCQMLAVCMDAGAIGVPIINGLTRMLFDKPVTLPSFHRARIYQGASETGYCSDKWTYRCTELYQAYDTEQCFAFDEKLHDGQMVDMRASYCMLSAWHLKGRYMPDMWTRIKQGLLHIANQSVRVVLLPFFGARTRSGRAPNNSINQADKPSTSMNSIHTAKPLTQLVRTVCDELPPLRPEPASITSLPNRFRDKNLPANFHELCSSN